VRRISRVFKLGEISASHALYGMAAPARKKVWNGEVGMSKHLNPKHIRSALTGVLLGGLISAAGGIPAKAQALSQDEANAIATEAYVYSTPLSRWIRPAGN
jgi:hypothetical protein